VTDPLSSGPKPEQAAEDVLTEAQRNVVRASLAELRALGLQIAEVFGGVDADTVGIDGFLDTRAKFGVCFVAINDVSARVTQQFGLTSAQDRLMHYLVPRLGKEVPAAELGGVSCIWEWARRTRELDVERGWEIKVGAKAGIREGSYMLASNDPDNDRAELWKSKNGIRKRPGSGESRVLALLQDRFPAAVHIDDLDYVARIRSRDRRKRDLEEAGWRIASIDTDPLLQSGWYRLESLEKGPPRARENLKLREELLRERKFTCERCLYVRNQKEPRPLQIHHIRFLREGGNDEKSNLLVLCRPCHAGLHALDQNSVDDELLNPSSDPLMIS
jgi:HNH endonuclease